MICKVCLKKYKTFDFINLFSPQPICKQCLAEMNPLFHSFKIAQNIKGLAIYKYNSKIREMLYLLKGAYDFEMSKYFLHHFKEYLSIKFHSYTLVFAPSSKEDNEERGFNHVEAIFGILRLKSLQILHKTQNIKQSNLSKEERKNIGKILEIDQIDLSNKKILLVDDVYTTGSTIRACIDLLKTRGAKKISVLVMSRRFNN